MTKIKGKTSVSEITENAVGADAHIDPGSCGQLPLQKISKKPKFLEGKIKLTRAEIGTITHLIMQKLDFSMEYDEDKLRELIDSLVEKEIISHQEAEAVPISNILRFTESELYNRIQGSKKVFKEQPFYINIPAKEIYANGIEENILVQGIIDIYFVDDEDNIILVDYKTDYIKSGNEQELINKYQKQLMMYKQAIEESTGKKVEETYIYSMYLGKDILVAN